MWNKDQVRVLFEDLRNRRMKAIKKKKVNSALAYEIIHHISLKPGKIFSGSELVDEFSLSSTHSLGGHLKAQTKVMDDLGMDWRVGHTWFVSWDDNSGLCRYWLEESRAKVWAELMKEYQK